LLASWTRRGWVYFWKCNHLKKYETCTVHVMEEMRSDPSPATKQFA
jgi:hypothetical protein